MSEPKTYAPASVKTVQTQYGEMYKFSFRADKMIEFIQQNTNAKGYVNLTISKRKEVSQYGESHSVALDTWEPVPGGGVTKSNKPAQRPATSGDDVP